MDTLEGSMLVLLHQPALKTYWQRRRDLSLAMGFRRTGVSRGQLARVVCRVPVMHESSLMWRTGGAEAGGEGLAAGSHNEQRLIAHTADAVYNGGCRGRLWGGRDALPRQPLHCGSPGWPAAVTPAGVNIGSRWKVL